MAVEAKRVEATHGSQGQPRIPYARPFWDDDERVALLEVLESGAWTNGPALARFETELANRTGAAHAVTVSNGTAALWCVLHALFEARGATNALLVTTPINFAAAPAAARLCGYDVAFTDVGPELEMDPGDLEAILDAQAGRYDLVVVCPMHYAGRAVGMSSIEAIASKQGALVVEDACHAIGGTYPDTGKPVGSRPASAATVFSFHPTKNVAAGEGGAIVTADEELSNRVRALRNHNMRRTGAFSGTAAREDDGTDRPWYYEIDAPGVNQRMSDFHAAIASCQLRRLDDALKRRRGIADRYWSSLSRLRSVDTISDAESRSSHALHLFAVRFDLDLLDMTLSQVFETFSASGIDLQVHYTPLYRQPAFRAEPLVEAHVYPNCDRLASGLCSLPMHGGLSRADQDRVLAVIKDLEDRL